MPQYQVNDDAVAKARDLIGSHLDSCPAQPAHRVLRGTRLRESLDSEWGEAQPSADDGNATIERHGWDRYGAWHLAVDPDASVQTKARYAFTYGDFQRVHRSGLIAAKQRAAQNDHDDIERVADELPTLLDETSAS